MKSECYWAYQILDANPTVGDLGMCTLVDIDRDGIKEVIVGGSKGLFWYKYPNGNKHVIDGELHFGVGITCHDVDGDGCLELVVGVNNPHGIVWYDIPREVDRHWPRYYVDTNRGGYAHDLVFADLNGDHKNELVANSVGENAIYWYTVPQDPKEYPWPKHSICSGVLSEGLALADINGNGRMDVVAGPYWFEAPENLDGRKWKRHTIAKGFRERCTLDVGDVNRNGRMDVLIAEGEYVDGRWALFENVDGGKTWRKRSFEELVLSNTLYFAHTVLLEDIDGDKDLDIVIAEMGQGGWNAPRNIRAKVLLYENLDGIGGKWKRHLVHEGVGTHEAKVGDVDGDGEPEIVGKSWREPTIVQVWDRKIGTKPFQMQHFFIDKNKKRRAIDVLSADIDGDGLEDIVCGNVWYNNPYWKKHELPIIGQVLAVHDVNMNGKLDIIGVKGEVYPFSSELYWLEASGDPSKDEWIPHYIGTGDGDWPHGAAIGPVLEDGKIALIVGYHSAGSHGDLPQYFESPIDLTKPWTKKNLGNIRYGEEIVLADINRNGKLDIVAGPYWLKREGKHWAVHSIADPEDYGTVARVRAADINGNGRIDVVFSEENIDWTNKTVGLGRVTWFESPEDPENGKWTEHVVSVMRCPHSLDVADLDGDGQLEIIVAEHDPFMAYYPTAFCKLAVYKRVDEAGTVWEEHVIDARYEHHCGAHVIQLDKNGTLGIVSHGWVEEKYVHLWKPQK